jgi:hypothetical protein
MRRTVPVPAGARVPVIGGLVLAVVVGASACSGSIGGSAGNGGPGNNPGGGPGNPGGGPGNNPGGGPGNNPGGGPGPGNEPPPGPGELAHTPMRRLTRAQYNNTIRDLLGVTGDTAGAFALDENDGGFASNATAPVKELQLDKYREAAEDLANKATADMARLVPCAPPAKPEAACVDEFLRDFGKRAYRRPLEADELTRYKALFNVGKDGTDFATAIRLVVSTMLQSPNFIYMPELGDPRRVSATGKMVALTHYEAASRLSYYLQNTMPDAELFAAADAGKLGTADELAMQARRLMQSPRGRDTVVSFHAQWLQTDDLLTVEKSATSYPMFTPEVRAAMKDELDEFADQVVRQGDGKLETLLTAGFSFLRGPLYGVYGVSAAGGAATGMRRADLPAGQRAGILTLAGVMAKHAHPDQSSPVGRGYVISDRLLCVVPPDPPDNVDANVPTPDPNSTTRARFEMHRTKPDCAACHALMDPLGLPFESYDGMGRYRTMDGRQAVDPTSALANTDNDGPVKNAVELMGRLAQTSEVKRCVSRQWFRYAFGRIDTAADGPSIDAALDAFARGGFKVPDLVVGIASTDTFRFRRPVEP